MLKERLRDVRRLLPVLIGLLLVAGGLLGLLAFASGRDDPGVSAGAPEGPGVRESAPGDPPTSGDPAGSPPRREGRVTDEQLVAALALGNVALVYGTERPPPALVALRNDAAGPFRPDLASTGLAALLVRRPGVEGVQALAWQRRLETSDADDPLLRDFIDAWLGRGR